MPVHYEVKGRIGHIQLEGRGDYNVFSPDYVYNPFHDALTAYRQDPEVWVVIVSAVAGRKAFTYGGDIQSLDALAGGDDEPRGLVRPRRWSVPRGRVGEALQPPSRIGSDFGLGHPGCLEVLDVERVVPTHHPEHGGGPRLVGWCVGHAKKGDCPDHVGAQQGRGRRNG